MEPSYKYEGIKGVSDYRQFFPEDTFRNNHFLSGLVKCIVKTVFRMSTIAYNIHGTTEPTMRILEKKLEKCFQELQFYLLNKSVKPNVTPTETKNMAKMQMLEILQLIKQRVDAVIIKNNKQGLYARNMRGYLNTIIKNVEAENFKNVTWPPSRLQTRRQPTQFETTAKQFSDLKNMSTIPRIQNFAPEFRTTLEEYLEPPNYGRSGTKKYIRNKKTRKTR